MAQKAEIQIKEQESQQLFTHLPKGADLHSHFSSIITYDHILQSIKDNNLANKLVFDQTTMELMFSDQKSKTSKNNTYLTFEKDEAQIKTLLKRYIDGEYLKGGTQYDKQFNDAFTLGTVFYHLLKAKIYYLIYIRLIFEDMVVQNITHLEMRMKLDFLTEQRSHQSSGEVGQLVKPEMLLEGILAINKEEKYEKKSIRVIVQFPRDAPKLKQKMYEFFNFMENKDNSVKFKDLIIGVDFTGKENQLLNKTVLQDKECLEKLAKFQLQYFSHAGEHLVHGKEIGTFKWKDNIPFQNVAFLISDFIPNHRSLFIKSIRIGHGVIFLQHLYHLKQCDQQQFDSLMQRIKQLNLCFEVCPIANFFYGGVHLDRNIYHEFRDMICINSDDTNKVHRNLSDNFEYLVNELEISQDDLKIMIKNSIIFSDLPQDRKDAILVQINQELDQYMEQHSFYRDSDIIHKHRQQWAHLKKGKVAWWWGKRPNPYVDKDKDQDSERNKKIKFNQNQK